jgi:hypothetical protein
VGSLANIKKFLDDYADGDQSEVQNHLQYVKDAE